MPEQRFAFVLRILIEKEPRAGSSQIKLRGLLQSVHSGETRYFRSLDAIANLVQELLHLPPSSESSCCEREEQ